MHEIIVRVVALQETFHWGKIKGTHHQSKLKYLLNPDNTAYAAEVDLQVYLSIHPLPSIVAATETVWESRSGLFSTLFSSLEATIERSAASIDCCVVV